MHSPYFISYICYHFPHLFCPTHGELNDWAIVILRASWQDITKLWFQIKKGPYGGRVQARWLSDTRNGQRQNPVQAHMSIGNTKNHKTNPTPFSGNCNCHSGIYTDSADLFQDQMDGNLQQKWPCSAQYYHRRAGKRKEKKQPCKTQQAACGKHKTWGPFMRTYYRNATSEGSDMSLDRKILLPSFRD